MNTLIEKLDKAVELSQTLEDQIKANGEFAANYHNHVIAACEWALERETVRIKKAEGQPKPWTEDTFIRDHRFCNVNRMHDKETEILFKEFYTPHHHSKDMWFNVAVARWINWSPTVLKLGWTDLTNGYDADDLYTRFCAVGREDKLFTGAYMIRGCGNPAEVDGDLELYEKCKDKRYFLAHVVFKAIYEIGPPEAGETLQSYHSRLTKAKSNGDFMAGQQIADLKYMTMRDAPDWKTWAPIGPGPVRFLNRLHGRPLTKSIPVAQHYLELAQLSEAVKVALPQVAIQHGYSAEVEALVQFHLEDAHNIGSNLLCETDKYLRLKEGGQVRSKYNGAGAPQPKATTHSLI